MSIILIISSIAVTTLAAFTGGTPPGGTTARPTLVLATPVLPLIVDDEVRAIIDDVDAAAERAGSRINIVRIRARAANLIWLIDPSMGRLRFNRLRAWINSNIDAESELEQARIELLQQLSQRDPGLAGEWLQDIAGAVSAVGQNQLSLTDRLRGRSERTRFRTRLAERAMEQDPTLATRLLGENLAEGYTYPAHAALLRLARLNPAAASPLNGVILTSLEKAAANPDAQAVIAAQLLFDHFFPRDGGLPVGSVGGPRPMPDQSTRQRYFVLAERLLQQSLPINSGNSLPESDRQLLAASQALLAARLSSVSADISGTDPSIVERLRSTTRSLRPNIPSELTGAASAPESAPGSSASGPESSLLRPLGADPGSTLRSINQIENPATRSLANRAITLQTVKSMIARRDLAEALVHTLAIEEVTTRLPLLAELFNELVTEREAHFSRYLAALIVRNAVEWGPSEIKSELLLSLAGNDSSLRLLEAAIESLNSLPPGSERLLTGNSFRKAFFDTARLDKDAVIVKIADIRSVAFELMARLALSEALLTTKTKN